LDEIDGPFGSEKMEPVISLFTVSDAAQGLETCKHILANEGRGHTAVIHTNNQAWIDRFGRE
jgi:acetaldehyde dehydrogenase (acetylating)